MTGGHPAPGATGPGTTTDAATIRATMSGLIEFDLLLAVAIFALVLFVGCRWLLRAERTTGGGDDQPTVRRTNPARPIQVSTATDTSRAPRYATVGMVSIDGVSAARSPSLTYTSGLISTPICNQGIDSSAAQG